MTKLTLLSALASALLLADTTLAACTRAELQAANDAFYANAIAKKPYALSPGAKISENKKFVSSLADTGYTKITGYHKDYKLIAIDEAMCQVASFSILNEGSDPAIFSVRLKLPESGAKPSEVEILNTTKGSGAMFFQPNAFAAKAPATWSETHSPPLNREALLATTSSYANGIEKKDGNMVKAQKGCSRVENGFKIGVACNALFQALGFPVYSRRWVVDTTTGVVQGSYYFGSPIGGLYTHEFFRTKNGLIQEVEANWIPANGKEKDPWTGIGNGKK
jgi:hypothetical protein